ncbi:Uncharacterized protein GBIM_01551 [Gryllus bimaculatus]|nr:Uncharacterized protein GBIM_01551 [Gryllus bimaculatus]
MAGAAADDAAAAAAAAAAATCGCTNIAIMQLFHELKQQFPAVPDRVRHPRIISTRIDVEMLKPRDR